MFNYEEQSRVLASPFDKATHKATFKNYLEVVIFSDGRIEYAIPSHQEMLMRICCEQLDLTRDELNRIVPREYYCDMITWLSKTSGCIAVRHIGYEGIANDVQLKVLKELAQYGLYLGDTGSKEEYHAFRSV